MDANVFTQSIQSSLRHGHLHRQLLNEGLTFVSRGLRLLIFDRARGVSNPDEK